MPIDPPASITDSLDGFPATYYSATRLDVEGFPRLEADLECDTCIIGGGYAGLMTALGLVERGHKNVIILEAERIGWGASGRNGGFVFGGYSLGPRALVKKVGLEQARALYQLTVDAVELIRRRVNEHNIDCDLVDEGVLWANWFRGQQGLLDEKAFMAEHMGVDWQYIAPKQLDDWLVSDRYHGALYEPNAMHFHPLNYALAISQLLKQQGVRIYENSPVSALNYNSPEKQVNANGYNIKCRQLVISAGGYIGQLCRPVSRSVLPIATYVMATEPLGESLQSLMKTNAAVYDTRFAFDYYRPLKDTRILWGGRVSARTSRPNNLQAQLKTDLLKVFPELADVKVDYAWDGWMSYARHQMAQIGQIAPGVWYGIGFGGHGVGPTTAAGEVLASAISGENENYRHFSPWGLPWNGGVFGPIAAQASYWWYQTRDWLNERLGR